MEHESKWAVPLSASERAALAGDLRRRIVAHVARAEYFNIQHEGEKQVLLEALSAYGPVGAAHPDPLVAALADIAAAIRETKAA